ncbi:MAG: hypothetical protein ACLPKE_35305 [Streptosporangiaceae bacterium]
MTSLTAPEAHSGRQLRLRSWRTVAGLGSVAAGAAIILGAALPWVETFAGLIGIPGLRGSNGRMLAAAGAVIAAAGIYQLARGGQTARWLTGVTGFAALGFSGYLLIQLTRSMAVLGGDSMVAARGGPGLWVAAAGSAAAFGTLFLPPSAQTTLRRERPGGAGGGGRAGGLSLAWAADRESAGARRGLQVALGMVWLLDAALQYQPYMFSRHFVTDVLAPASIGNPAVLADPAAWAARIIGHDVVAWNAAFATIQLALAGGLLWRRTARAALAGTIGWALAVWLLAEGAGGVLSGMHGMASPITGAPGAAVLYALLALLIWPGRGAGNSAHRSSVAAGGPLGLRAARACWIVLWGSFGYLVLKPAVWSGTALRGTFTGLARGEPHWLATLNDATAAALSAHPAPVAGALAVAFALTAAGILWPATLRPALALAIVLALFIWVAGEDFGGLLTGQATDPNSGPLLILLSAAFWPPRGVAAAGKSRWFAPCIRRIRGGRPSAGQ